MDTTKNNGIVLATLIITMIILSIILSITFAITLKNPSLQQLLPGIRKRNIEKIYQEQLDARIQQEKFTGNEETDNNKVHQIITEIVQREHTIVGEIPKYTTGFEHDYTFTIQEKNKNIKLEITLKSKPELNSALQQVSMDSGYTKTIPLPLPKVGDTIIYDPTKGVTDQSKLTYISPKEQNGYGEQKIIAKPENKEWVVISTSGGQVKMMSKEPIDGIEGGRNGGGNKQGFTLKGGKGYLYAEEELHRMCSVFGHGKGAGKISTKYTVGNQYIGEAEERTLSGSGARSLILSDIVSVIKGEGQDFTDKEKKSFNSDYKTSVSSEVYYPTKVSTKENGTSDDKKSFTEDRYGISKDQYTNYAKSETKTAREALVNSIFKYKQYWYASRFVSAYSGYAYFRVGFVYSIYVDTVYLFCRCRFSRCVGPKTCGLFGLFRPIREE